MSQKRDWSYILGTTINYLTILNGQVIENNKQKINVECVCGKQKTVMLSNILSGSVKSCGCMKGRLISSAKTIHGMRGASGIYSIFRSMKTRCTNQNRLDYKYYGGKGVTCKWDSFEEFYKDMGLSYKKGLTLDRIDNNGNYCKENCRWTTIDEQARNRSNNRKIFYQSREYCLSELSRKLGVHHATLGKRIDRGLPESARGE